MCDVKRVSSTLEERYYTRATEAQTGVDDSKGSRVASEDIVVVGIDDGLVVVVTAVAAKYHCRRQSTFVRTSTACTCLRSCVVVSLIAACLGLTAGGWVLQPDSITGDAGTADNHERCCLRCCAIVEVPRHARSLHFTSK